MNGLVLLKEAPGSAGSTEVKRVEGSDGSMKGSLRRGYTNRKGII